MLHFIKQLLRVILNKPYNDNGVSVVLAYSAVKLFILQCLSLSFGLLLNYLLVKSVDLNTYGSYVYIFNLLSLLLSFSVFGVDTLLVRSVAVFVSLNKFQQLKGILIFSIAIAVIGSVIAGFFSAQFLHHVHDLEKKMNVKWVALAIPALIILSIASLCQACLQAQAKMVQSQLGDKLLRPIIMILLVVSIVPAAVTISLQQLIWMNLLAIGTALLISLFFFRTSIYSKIKNVKPLFELGSWFATTVSFFAVNILYVLNSRADILLLGTLIGNKVVGIYNVVLKISEIISFVLAIINFIIAPLAARLYNEGELIQLQKLVTRSAQVTLVISLPMIVSFIIFRNEILLFFGIDFLNGKEAFVILCLGQLLNVLFGSVGTLLMMSGNQRFSMISLIFSLLLNIILNLVLVPQYAILGTAIATASSLGLWNLLMYFFVRKKMKIRTTAFAII